MAISTLRSASGRTRYFDRDGADLSCEVPDRFCYGDASGGEVELPTLERTMFPSRFPAGTQSGKKSSDLRGKGVTTVRDNTQPAILFAKVAVETPINLTEKQTRSLHCRNFEASV